jgi:hypothetical protein
MEALKSDNEQDSDSKLELVEADGNEEAKQEESCLAEYFHDCLSLISPQFIESMTTFSGGGKKDPLVDVLSSYLGIEESKNFQSKEQQELSPQQKRGRAKILPFGTSEESRKKDKMDECESTSAFIYKEKKKSEKVNKQVKGREIIELYQKSSQVNVKQERALRDDLSKSYKVGVLINKRQY